MALAEEMARAGARLFRHRSWAPPAVLGLVIAATATRTAPSGPSGLDPLPAAIGGGLAAAGLVLRALVTGHAPRGTSGKNRGAQVAETLTTTGLYSVVRHPLYLANLFLWLGPAVATAVWWCPLIVALVFALYYERIMLLEESFLRTTFGTAFDEWADRTPAFVPRLAAWRPPALSFSWKTVLRQEYYAFFSAVAMFTLLEAATVWHETGRPGLSRPWIVAVAAAAVAAGTCRILQRYTTRLDVEGR